MKKKIKDLDPGDLFTDFPKGDLKHLHNDKFVRLSNRLMNTDEDGLSYPILNLSTMRADFVPDYNQEVTVIGKLDLKETYKRGFIDGMTAFAFNEHGQRVVGPDTGCEKTGRTLLSDAIENVEELINFDPDGGDESPNQNTGESRKSLKEIVVALRNDIADKLQEMIYEEEISEAMITQMSTNLTYELFNFLEKSDDNS